MNEKDNMQMRNMMKEMIRLKIKPNFAALGREYGCDYRTAKIKYLEELSKEKGIEPTIKIRKHIIDEYKDIIINKLETIPGITAYSIYYFLKVEKNYKGSYETIKKFVKEKKDFDFDYQPSINKNVITDLATLRFIEEKKNVLFMGNPGVGKTHLATALGIEAAKKRNSVYFISCNDLITNLSNAFKENRLESKIKFYCKYRLLIIDEIGYLPITREEANMFFQLIAKKYENKPTIITTNQPFSKWGEVFGDTTIASAIIDRLVHHSVIMNIKGKSYRIKDLVQEDFNEEKSS